jgi:Flp pilus assembly pilin Flp
MSDLITTTEDFAREACIQTLFGVRRAGTALAQRAKDPRGQTAAEYMGVLLLVALIIVAVVGTGVAGKIAGAVSGAVDQITSQNPGAAPKGDPKP